MLADEAPAVVSSAQTRAQIAATKARRAVYGELSPTIAPRARERMIVVQPGDRYGRWTVLREASRDYKGRRHMRVRCECGREETRPLYGLRAGASTGCQSKACQQRATEGRAA